MDMLDMQLTLRCRMMEPLNIGVKDNQLMVDKNGDKFVDKLQDLGWDYDRMSSSGQQVYDELLTMLGIT